MYVVEAGLQGRGGNAGTVLALAGFPCPFSPPAELGSSWLTLGTCLAVPHLGSVCKLSQEGAQI